MFTNLNVDTLGHKNLKIKNFLSQRVYLGHRQIFTVQVFGVL